MLSETEANRDDDGHLQSTEESKVLYDDLETWKKGETETDSQNLQKEEKNSEMKPAGLEQDFRDLKYLSVGNFENDSGCGIDDPELEGSMPVAAPSKIDVQPPDESSDDKQDVVLPTAEQDRAQMPKEVMLHVASGDIEEKKEVSSAKIGVGLTEVSEEADEVDEAVVQMKMDLGMRDLMVQLQQERARVTEFASENMELTSQVKYHLVGTFTTVDY